MCNTERDDGVKECVQIAMEQVEEHIVVRI